MIPLILHLSLSASGASASYLITQHPVAAVSIPLAAGFGREFTQSQELRQWSRANSEDMAANLAGAVVGAAVTALIAHALER